MSTREIYGGSLGVCRFLRKRGLRGTAAYLREHGVRGAIANARAGRRPLRTEIRGIAVAYLLVAPTLLVSAVFLYYPAIKAFELSFYQTLFFGGQRTWVGLGNYETLLESSSYHESVAVTVAFAAVVVGGVMAVSLVVSALLHEVDWGQSWYLIAAIWPYALPPAVAGTVFLFLVHPSIGTVTGLVEGYTPIDVDWFSNGRQAFVVVTAAAIWKQLGYNVIFMLAALNKVPETLTEAAELDGVGRWTRLLRVYAPLISPTLLFLVVMNTIYAFFGTFAFIDLMTQGGPGGATNVLIFDLYRNAFEFNNHGLASAQSIVLFVVVSALMYAQLRLSNDRVHYGA
ncbi:carbohydrate ABC transporter permease [Halopiger djelfimassiliensis]|uniref:carbohydrate ABC transporter permease n=1 Tax=Halopiger djelfimassiliensis TaxID=1293047 RepID=UPI0009DB90C9|nr:sugar ABC transporter permease [Halopiger djelfimassiliensis]